MNTLRAFENYNATDYTFFRVLAGHNIIHKKFTLSYIQSCSSEHFDKYLNDILKYLTSRSLNIHQRYILVSQLNDIQTHIQFDHKKIYLKFLPYFIKYIQLSQRQIPITIESMSFTDVYKDMMIMDSRFNLIHWMYRLCISMLIKSHDYSTFKSMLNVCTLFFEEESDVMQHRFSQYLYDFVDGFVGNQVIDLFYKIYNENHNHITWGSTVNDINIFIYDSLTIYQNVDTLKVLKLLFHLLDEVDDITIPIALYNISHVCTFYLKNNANVDESMEYISLIDEYNISKLLDLFSRNYNEQVSTIFLNMIASIIHINPFHISFTTLGHIFDFFNQRGRCNSKTIYKQLLVYINLMVIIDYPIHTHQKMIDFIETLVTYIDNYNVYGPKPQEMYYLFDDLCWSRVQTLYQELIPNVLVVLQKFVQCKILYTNELIFKHFLEKYYLYSSLQHLPEYTDLLHTWMEMNRMNNMKLHLILQKYPICFSHITNVCYNDIACYKPFRKLWYIKYNLTFVDLIDKTKLFINENKKLYSDDDISNIKYIMNIELPGIIDN